MHVNASPVHQKLTVSQECGTFPKANCLTLFVSTCRYADPAARPEANTEAALARLRVSAYHSGLKDISALSADVARHCAFNVLSSYAGKQVLLQRGQRQRKKPQWLDGTIDPHVPDKKWGLPTGPQVPSTFP